MYISIWDGNYHLVTDRFSEKPLFIYEQNKIIFSRPKIL